MKNKFVTGCIVVLSVFLAIIIGCGCYAYFKVTDYTNKCQAVVEEMINNKLPSGYIALYGGKSDQDSPYYDSSSVLLNIQTGAVFLIRSGKPSASPEAKEQLIANELKFFESKRIKSTSHTKTGPKEEIVGGKQCTKYYYKQTTLAGQVENYMVAFFESQQHSFCLYYVVKDRPFNENEANKFIQLVNN